MFFVFNYDKQPSIPSAAGCSLFEHNFQFHSHFLLLTVFKHHMMSNKSRGSIWWCLNLTTSNIFQLFYPSWACMPTFTGQIHVYPTLRWPYIKHVYTDIYLSIYPSIHPSIHPSIYLSIYVYIYMHLVVYIYIQCIHIYINIHIHVHIHIHILKYVCVSILYIIMY